MLTEAYWRLLDWTAVLRLSRRISEIVSKRKSEGNTAHLTTEESELFVELQWTLEGFPELPIERLRNAVPNMSSMSGAYGSRAPIKETVSQSSTESLNDGVHPELKQIHRVF